MTQIGDTSEIRNSVTFDDKTLSRQTLTVTPSAATLSLSLTHTHTHLTSKAHFKHLNSLQMHLTEDTLTYLHVFTRTSRSP